MNDNLKDYNDYTDKKNSLQDYSPIQAIAFEIIKDISSRKGIGNEWDYIDDATKDEILETWYSIIHKVLVTN